MSNKTQIKVLLIDNSSESCTNIQTLMSYDESVVYDIQWTDNYIKGIKTLTSDDFDICFVKYELENNGGIEFLKYAYLHDRCMPTILYSDKYDKTIQAAADDVEATDYIAVNELSPKLLQRAVRYAMQLKKNERKLLELSYSDTLTGIPNRTLFQIRVNDAIAQTKRNDTIIAILFLDVDGFKDINDLMGYPAGDQLLIEIAKRLQGAMRESDIISRLGGDQFAIVATNILSENDAIAVANRILNSLVDPINIESFDFKINLSIGVALCPSDGETVEEIMRNGDEALYQAKKISRGTYHFFNREMQNRRIENQKFEKYLSNSLERNELFLQYQPLIELKSGKVIGAEALVRWEHPEQGLIPPDKFIPIAESSGFINDLGNWVLLQACRQCADWNKKISEDFNIAVNVSLAQIKKGDFVEVVQDTILQTGLNYSNLTLEITESMIADNTKTVLESLNRLREMGVHISVDDFGAGHSSLARLKNFPVNDLKIDRSLISNVAEDQQDAAIAIAILTLARELKLDVIAEGIETEQQANFMKKHDCAYVQGYLYSRPVLAEEFEKNFIKAHSKTA